MQPEPTILTVTEGQAGQRLDVFLVPHFAGQSRAGVQRWIKDNFVLLGSEPQPNPARKVRVGEVYTVNMPEITATTLIGEDIPLDIIYEDADLLVLNKPAGLTVHPAPGNFTGTLVQALIYHCKDSLSGINGQARPGIVHRIDKDTSGLLVVAKHDIAHRGLAKQFAKHSIHRVYTALVRGTPRPAVGTITTNIGRHPVHRMRRAVLPSGGKHAITHYKVTQTFGQAASLVECQLETGRTHQIRVHLAHLGCPLIGDPMYGNPSPLKGLGPLPALTGLRKGQLLHAGQLGFTHPLTGQSLNFTVPLPPDMLQIQAHLQKSTKTS